MKNLEKNEPDIYESPDYGGNYGAEMPEEKPGHIGERIVGEFIQEAFRDIITKVEKTSRFDQNDRNGVDYVFEVAGNGKFAVDITFESFHNEKFGAVTDDRMQLKRDRMEYNPCVAIHDQGNKAVSEPIPRLLINGGRNLGLWFMFANIAKERKLKLMDYMDQEEKKAKREKMVSIMDQIVNQVIFYSKDADYKERAKGGLEVFKKKADELGINYPGKEIEEASKPKRKKAKLR